MRNNNKRIFNIKCKDDLMQEIRYNIIPEIFDDEQKIDDLFKKLNIIVQVNEIKI